MPRADRQGGAGRSFLLVANRWLAGLKPLGDDPLFLEPWEGLADRNAAKGRAEALRRAREAIAVVQDRTVYADGILTDLYSIRDRLASLELQTAELVAQIRKK
jgi:hypothetical protein